MKKSLFAFVMFMTFALTACGGSDTKDTAAKETSVKKAEAQKLEAVLIESGYSCNTTSSGDVYLNYSATINNPNDEYAFEFPKIIITAKDKDGKIVGNEEQTLFAIAPNDTITFGSLVDCNGIVPDAVEIMASSGNFIFSNDSIIPSSNFVISNTNEIIGNYDISYTGEIENIGDKDVKCVAITLTLKDNGNIVYGSTSYVDDVLSGQKKAFEFSEYNVPEHTEYIISAQSWR